MTDFTRLLRMIEGPHEWGYRDPTDGSFIKDNAPFEMATDMMRLAKALCRTMDIEPDDSISDGGHQAWQMVMYVAIQREKQNDAPVWSQAQLDAAASKAKGFLDGIEWE